MAQLNPSLASFWLCFRQGRPHPLGAEHLLCPMDRPKRICAGAGGSSDINLVCASSGAQEESLSLHQKWASSVMIEKGRFANGGIATWHAY